MATLRVFFNPWRVLPVAVLTSFGLAYAAGTICASWETFNEFIAAMRIAGRAMLWAAAFAAAAHLAGGILGALAAWLFIPRQSRRIRAGGRS